MAGLVVLNVGSNGEVTLPAHVLAHLGISPGDRLAVALQHDGKADIKKLDGTFGSFFNGVATPFAEPVSIKDMNEAIAKGWAGEP